ncbi:MAG: TetR/AcrR family transcriptional regulator [Gammaproteobacteria bacterium]|nr:TetR/AcrR family transcriptional regulator [Gammaproteobacteria bacterium]
MNAGRKKTFDTQEALDKATKLFWLNGYSGTSISDLTATLGINKPSLYNAFGNKEHLFQASLDHYMKHYGSPRWEKLNVSEEIPLEHRLKAFLQAVIKLVTDPGLPQGCLFVKSTCDSNSHALPEAITQTLKELASNNLTALEAVLRKERAAGSIPPTVDIDQMATYLASVLYGIAVLARSGSSADSLQKAADMAVSTLLQHKG